MSIKEDTPRLSYPCLASALNNLMRQQPREDSSRNCLFGLHSTDTKPENVHLAHFQSLLAGQFSLRALCHNFSESDYAKILVAACLVEIKRSDQDPELAKRLLHIANFHGAAITQASSHEPLKEAYMLYRKYLQCKAKATQHEYNRLPHMPRHIQQQCEKSNLTSLAGFIGERILQINTELTRLTPNLEQEIPCADKQLTFN